MTAALLAGLTAVCALAEVLRAGLAPTEPAANTITRWVAGKQLDDYTWRTEQLRQAAFNPVPDDGGYWTPASLAELMDQARLAASLRRVHTALYRQAPEAPGQPVIARWWRPVGRPPMTVRRTPGATLIGAAAA